MEICKACPHLTDRLTCGTPVVGNIVEHNGKHLRTCGCFMNVKTRLKWFSCPLGKWNGEDITPEKACEIKKFIEGINTSLSGKELEQLFGFADLMHGRKVERTTCSPCIKKYIEDLKKQVRDIYCE